MAGNRADRKPPFRDRYHQPMPASTTRPLKVGVQLPEVEREVRWPEILDMTRAIEDEGFDSVWVGEHLLYRWEDRPPRGPWEAWTQLGAIAAVTSRIELGPLVACTNFHNPALLAKQAATLDEVSGGRFVLGLGAGWNEPEFRAYGYPFDHRIDRFEEAFTIIRALLCDGAIDFDGRWYQARDCELLPRGPRPNGPPIMIGSNGPRMLRITMPQADSWNSWFSGTGNRPEGVAPLRDVVDKACRDAGRDPEEVERTVAIKVQMPEGRGRVDGSYARSPVEPMTGSPAEMAEVLRAFAREGVAHVQLVVDPITTESIRGLAPVLAELDKA
jgi:probable F420-dependent oxidoreductase